MKLYETLINQLKKENNFVTDEGEVKKWVVADKARNYDSELLACLLNNEDLKNTFFKDVNGVKVFLLEKFLLFIEQKNYLNDSYTAYRNKIGLTIGGRFLNQRNEVELVWPYKDCILEGGQTKEDQKRAEIFFNQTLAQDEITQLLDPKVLTNYKRYGTFSDDAIFHRDAALNEKRGLPKDTITDNLIIKGNNLLALHSLKKEFAGKVKLIYIDPPYNTRTDTFGYNDSFNHSSWLVFMKNRLEIAKELLKDDGAIYIQLDFHEVHYAKVLMDEIFGVNNFQREIVWRIGWLSGYKTTDKNWIRNHDTILFYSKKESNLSFIKKYIPASQFKKIAQSDAERYPIEDVWNGNEYDDLNSIAIVSFSGETVSKMLNKEDEVKGQKSEKLLQRIIDAHIDKGDIVLDFFGGSGTTAAVAHKMGVQYILCEQLDKHIDITLRRLQNVINGDQSGISKSIGWNPQNPTLEDAANGRYSRNNFIYLELKKFNQTFIERIETAQDTETLLQIWQQMKEKSFLAYNIDIKTQEANMEEFKQLELAEQKQVLCELLDKNQLYVNVSDMSDSRFETSEEERKVTEAFYSKK